MTMPITPQSLLEQILQIPRMEHGSISVVRTGPKGPYYNLNSWEKGKNRCRYLPQEKLAEVQQAIAGYQQYQQLTKQYAQQIIDQTRADLSIGVKKNSPAAAPNRSAPHPRRPRS